MQFLRYLILVTLAVMAGCATTEPAPETMTAPGAGVSLKMDAAPIGAKPAEADKKPAPDKKDEQKADHKLYPGSGVFVQAPPMIAPPPPQPQDVSLNFEGADLREVIRVVLGELLHENYVIDPRVQGMITVRTSQPITRAGAISTLDVLLRMNGAAMVKDDDGYRISPIAGALKGNATPRLGLNLPPGYGIQVVPLQYISAREMSKILTPLVPDGSIVRVDELRNLLMLSGGERDLRHALETVGMFDVDWLAGMSVGLFTLRNVEVKAIMPELQKIFGDEAKGPFSGMIRVIPLERMNAIFLVTPQPKYLDQAKTWIDRLDTSGRGGANLHVYHVQNGRADKLADLLNQLYSGKASQQQAETPAASVAPGLTSTDIGNTVASGIGAGTASTNFSFPSSSGGAAKSQTSIPAVAGQAGKARFIADKDNNALIVLATPEEYATIEDAIRKIDIIPRQVLIEVTIAEVRLIGDLQYGLEWYFKGQNSTQGQLNMNKTGEFGPKQPGFAFWKLNEAGAISAVLNALSTTSNLKILSSPHLMVADNQTAKIQVGQRVPTISSTQTVPGASTGVISAVQYLDTGVMLSVTPRINVGGAVRMDVTQEVSDAVATTTSTIDSPTITKRAAQSTLVVQSGETVLMGGLILDGQSSTNSGLPLLSDIPLLGGMFGTQQRNDSRTELIMLITPRVAENAGHAKEITQEMRTKLHGLGQVLSRRVLTVETGATAEIPFPDN